MKPGFHKFVSHSMLSKIIQFNPARTTSY